MDNTASSDKIVGQIIGSSYQALEKIGVGGMGAIYKVNDLRLDTIMALKLVNPVAGSASADAVQRLRRESQALAELEHPNIVAVKTFGLDPNAGAYLVMEYVEGIDLGNFIKEHGSLLEDQFRAIFLPICSALTLAHANNILHRDLKPSNIMLVSSEDGTLVPKLVDFGLAKKFDVTQQVQKLTSSGAAIGSVNYMSPEQCSAEGVDERSDVYSLACTIYEAMTGEVPFIAESAIHCVYRHMNETLPPLPGDKWPALSSVLQRCTAVRPGDRLQSIAEMSQAIEERLMVAPPAAVRRKRTAPISNVAYFVLGFCIFVITTLVLLNQQTHLPTGSQDELYDKAEQYGREGDFQEMRTWWENAELRRPLSPPLKDRLGSICEQQALANPSGPIHDGFRALLLDRGALDLVEHIDGDDGRSAVIGTHILRLFNVGYKTEAEAMANTELLKSQGASFQTSNIHRVIGILRECEGRTKEAEREFDLSEATALTVIRNAAAHRPELELFFVSRLEKISLHNKPGESKVALALIQDWFDTVGKDAQTEPHQTVKMLLAKASVFEMQGDRDSILEARRLVEKALDVADTGTEKHMQTMNEVQRACLGRLSTLNHKIK